MTVSFIASGLASAAATGNKVYALPAGVAADDLLVLLTALKPPSSVQSVSPVYKSDFSSIIGNNAAQGVDVGDMRAEIFSRVAVGTETAPTVTAPASSPQLGQMHAFRKTDAAKQYGTRAVGGGNANASTSFSATMSPAVTYQAGDWLSGLIALPGNDVANVSNIALSIPGCTLGALTLETAGTAAGDDGSVAVFYVQVVTGSATAAVASITATFSSAQTAVARMLRIREVAASANPVASFTKTVGTAGKVTFDSSPSTDPNGASDLYGAYWDFGDGRLITTANIGSLQVTYAAAGTYTVKLIVNDQAGNQGATSQSVVVPAFGANQPPIASYEWSHTSTLTAGVDGSGSFDPDGSIAKHDWAWGDGTSDLDAGPLLSHKYAAPGAYSVVLTVTDNAGATATQTQSVVISSNVSPIAAWTSTVTDLSVRFDARESSDVGGQEAAQWTTLASQANPFPVTALRIEAVVGTYQAEATTTGAKYDSLRVGRGDLYGSGDQVGFTVQTLDTLPAGVYYWRARAIDPAGSNVWSAFTAGRSFTVGSVNAAGTGGGAGAAAAAGGPSCALNTPSGLLTSDTTPTLEMTGIDAELNPLCYNVQISTSSTFATVLLDRTSGTHAGFASQDRFEDGIFSNTKWTRDNTTQILEQNQRLEMNSILAGNYVKLASKHYYDHTNISATAQIISVGNQSLVGWETYPLILSKDANNDLYFSVRGGVIAAEKKVGGVNSGVGAGVPYDRFAHQYLRIRGAGGTIYWEVSADAFIKTYSWDFGDGTTGIGVEPTHVYATGGTKQVTLVVTDNGGFQAELSKQIVINTGSVEEVDARVVAVRRYPRVGPGRVVIHKPPAPVVGGMVARTSESLYRSYGVNTHFSYLGSGSEWADTANAISWVQALGVGAIRQLLPATTAGRNAVKQAILALPGVDWQCQLYGDDYTTLVAYQNHVNSQLDWLVANIPLNRIKQFSGPNEANSKDLPDSEWVPRTRWAQQALFEETRKRPAFDGVEIAGPPLNMKGGANAVPSDAAALGDLSAWLDRGDDHIYPGDDDAEVDLDVKLAWLEPIHPGKPVTVSEGGYTTAIGRGYTGGSELTAEDPAGKYAVKHILIHSKVAGREFYSYELLDKPPPYASTDRETRESGFGIVRVPDLIQANWSEKPSFTAVKRLLALFKDTVHTPSNLVVTVSGPSDLRYKLYQRADGKWLLAMWRSVKLWTWNTATQSGSNVAVTNQTATVTFGMARPVSIYKPNVQVAAVSTVASTTSLAVTMGAEAQILEISGGLDTGAGGGGGGVVTPPVNAITRQIAVGDSMAWGVGIDLPADRWQVKLQGSSGKTVKNLAMPGDHIAGALAKQGGTKGLFRQSLTIPTSGSVTIANGSIGAFTDSNIQLVTITAVGADYGSIACTILGVAGTLDKIDYSGKFKDYRFTPNAGQYPTSPLLVPAGTVLVVTLGEQYRGDGQVYWIGHNDAREPGGAALVVPGIQTMADFGTGPYIVMGMTNDETSGNTTTIYSDFYGPGGIDAQLAAAHGSSFLEHHNYMLNSGLAHAKITPTAADNTNIAAGIIPVSLRRSANTGHLNAAGQLVVRDRIEQRQRANGWY